MLVIDENVGEELFFRNRSRGPDARMVPNPRRENRAFLEGDPFMYAQNAYEECLLNHKRPNDSVLRPTRKNRCFDFDGSPQKVPNVLEDSGLFELPDLSTFMKIYSKISHADELAEDPRKILDAPNLRNDFYLNVLDWSPKPLVAIGLNASMEILDTTKDPYTHRRLFSLTKKAKPAKTSVTWGPDLQTSTDVYVAAVKWHPHGYHNCMAVGLSDGRLKLWDVERGKAFQEANFHTLRVSSLAWAQDLLATGSKDQEVHLLDMRLSLNRIMHRPLSGLMGHRAEVCSLAFKNGGGLCSTELATGCNDAQVRLYDFRKGTRGAEELHPRLVFAQHRACVKAVSWNPWKSNRLVTGGGLMDQKIMVWETTHGRVLETLHAGSQVSGFVWNTEKNEFGTCAAGHTIAVYRYMPTSDKYRKFSVFPGHVGRILHFSQNPLTSLFISLGSDEKLRVWPVFEKEPDDHIPINKEDDFYRDDFQVENETQKSTTIRSQGQPQVDGMPTPKLEPVIQEKSQWSLKIDSQISKGVMPPKVRGRKPSKKALSKPKHRHLPDFLGLDFERLK